MKSSRAFWIWLLGFGIFGSACSLAGDVTPPPEAQIFNATNVPTAVATTAATEATPVATDSGLGYPTFKPSVAAGATVFAEHCAACHGDSGKGDGTMAARLPSPPPDLSLAATLRGLTLNQLFQTVTQGRQDKFMPPFSQLLSEEQRWNVAAYLYTLSTPQTQIDSGQALYEANCARCHGPEGAGDGPDAASAAQPLARLDDPSFAAGRSPQDFFDAVTQGAGPAMPGFAATLNDSDRWAVVDFLRTLAADYTAPVAAEALGTVTGRVINGTAGAAAPDSAEINLHSFDSTASVTTITTTVTPEGTFKFENVPYTDSRQFVVTAKYQEVIYGSEAVTFTGGQSTLNLPVTVYETTADPARIRIQQMHAFFEFGDVNVTVGEIYIFANSGDRTYWKPGGSLDFTLPAGAGNVQVPQREFNVDYVFTANGLSMITPVVPGEQAAQVIFTYELPYTDRLDFERTFAYPVDSANVLLPEVGVKFSGGLTDEGQQSIQGTAYHLYNMANLAAGESLKFTLSGRAGAAAATTSTNTTAIALGAGALVFALAGIGYWWYLRRSPGQPAPEIPDNREVLLQAIADLDDAFENNEIEERDYERRRAALKRRLVKLMHDD